MKEGKWCKVTTRVGGLPGQIPPTSGCSYWEDWDPHKRYRREEGMVRDDDKGGRGTTEGGGGREGGREGGGANSPTDGAFHSCLMSVNTPLWQ